MSRMMCVHLYTTYRGCLRVFAGERPREYPDISPGSIRCLELSAVVIRGLFPWSASLFSPLQGAPRLKLDHSWITVGPRFGLGFAWSRRGCLYAVNSTRIRLFTYFGYSQLFLLLPTLVHVCTLRRSSPSRRRRRCPRCPRPIARSIAHFVTTPPPPAALASSPATLAAAAATLATLSLVRSGSSSASHSSSPLSALLPKAALVFSRPPTTSANLHTSPTFPRVL